MQDCMLLSHVEASSSLTLLITTIPQMFHPTNFKKNKIKLRTISLTGQDFLLKQHNFIKIVNHVIPYIESPIIAEDINHYLTVKPAPQSLSKHFWCYKFAAQFSSHTKKGKLQIKVRKYVKQKSPSEISIFRQNLVKHDQLQTTSCQGCNNAASTSSNLSGGIIISSIGSLMTTYFLQEDFFGLNTSQGRSQTYKVIPFFFATSQIIFAIIRFFLIPCYVIGERQKGHTFLIAIISLTQVKQQLCCCSHIIIGI